ncbi:MAG: hypothetical protein ACPGTS_00415 [Minisyncoccia bacterium]
MIHTKLNMGFIGNLMKLPEKTMKIITENIKIIISSKIFTLWWRWSLLLGGIFILIWGHFTNWQFTDWVYFDSQANMHTRKFIPELLFLGTIVMPVLGFSIEAKSGFRNFIGWTLMMIICMIWMPFGTQGFFTVMSYLVYFIIAVALVVLFIKVMIKIQKIKLVKNGIDKVFTFFTANDKN